ncbi:MAG: putative molybdenum carrier protein [Planctomycetaceae bacterium]
MRIISGGQTGVDRAALDAALELGVPCGGWCPKGRRAEDGAIDARYPLDETETADYAERTELNVRDSDGTLVLTFDPPTGGTALTIEFARQHQRPCMIVDLDSKPRVSRVVAWCRRNSIDVLNVAGPRDGESTSVYDGSRALLLSLFAAIRG